MLGSSSKVMTKAWSRLRRITLNKKEVGVLLELDAIANAVGRIHQQADAQRQVRLPAEVADALRSFVIKNFEIIFFQIGNELVAAGEDPQQKDHKEDRGGGFGLRPPRRRLPPGGAVGPLP